ncbi:MAG TPA: CRISPR-associated protein Cas4, partial [Thermoanaerobaculia bacterium]|nr:CRISPR-associated protein Cas4 [Thermoanaerobaculia bacterium]
GVLHARADERKTESRGDLRIARGLPLRSLRLGLVGRADTVELHRPEGGGGAILPGVPGRWRLYPVEYKRGRPKSLPCDEVQLCAQALCLEEMLETEIPEGALFYGRTRKRKEVPFTPELRGLTEQSAARLHSLIAAGETPPPVNDARCERCSLAPVCLPAAPSRSARAYLRGALSSALAEAAP